MSLKQKAIKGIKWTSSSAVIVSVIQILQIIILTKLLSPSDFGIMAIILFIVNFSQNFIDFGISNAIIFKQEISKKALSSLYFLSICIGVLFFIGVFMSSSLIAGYYNDQRLVVPIQLISVIFIIVPFGQQYQVLLKKMLDFKSLAVIDVISRFAGFILTVVLAYFGYGVFSLVWGTILYSFISTLLLIIKGITVYKPSVYFSYSEIKPLIGFGFFQMGEKVVNYLNKEIDVLIIGKFLGMEVLGIYNIAKDFISKPYQLINPVITKVTFPVMASVQHDTVKIKRIYLETLKYLAIINSIIFFFCFFYSDEIVILFFGKEWIASSSILKILSIYMLIRSIGNPVGSLQLALGRADLGFYWNIVLLLIVPATIYFSKFYGIQGITVGLLLSQLLLYYPSWKYMVKKLSPISFREYNQAQYKFWILSIISTLFAFSITLLVNNHFFRFLIGGSIAISLYLLLLYHLDLQIRSLILKFFNRAKSTLNKR